VAVPVDESQESGYSEYFAENVLAIWGIIHVVFNRQVLLIGADGNSYLKLKFAQTLPL
jgi:hypothetical protein